MVSTHLKNISQNWNLPQVGMKIKNIWNHQLVYDDTYLKLPCCRKVTSDPKDPDPYPPPMETPDPPNEASKQVVTWHPKPDIPRILRARGNSCCNFPSLSVFPICFKWIFICETPKLLSKNYRFSRGKPPGKENSYSSGHLIVNEILHSPQSTNTTWL